MKQQQHEELTSQEINVLNLLKNLVAYESVTFKQIALFTGIQERRCNDVVENLRYKGYRVIASRNEGVRLAVSKDEWNEYVRKRKKEVENRLAALGKL